MSKYFYLTFFTLLSLFIISVKTCRSNKEEANRLAQNQNTLMTEIDYYIFRDSLHVASINQLILDQSEFKRYKSETAELIKDLEIKLKRVESTSKTVVKTEYKIQTTIKDSIVYKDTLKCFDYKNKHIDVAGCFSKDTVNLDIASRDTIVQVVHRIPRRFLFFNYGTKGIKQEILSLNPYTTIVYTEYIKLKK